MHILFLILQICLFGRLTAAYNVLAIFHTPAKSHYLGAEKLLRGLAADGNHVTVISPFPQKVPLPNFVDIALLGMEGALNDLMSTMFTRHITNNYKQIDFLYELGVIVTNFTLTHHRMTEFLAQKNQHFDVIIFEASNNVAVIGLGHHFNAPVIAYTQMGANMWHSDMVGYSAPVSIVPHQLMVCSDRMSFAQRMENTLLTAYDSYKFQNHFKHLDAIYQKVFPNGNKPKIDELPRQVSLVLVNDHCTISHPQPYLPNMIDIGGIHINRGDPKQLPEDIIQFVQDAPNGVIYFSLGSLVKSSNLPYEIRDCILKAFSKLKQRVLWKWEDPHLPGKSDNVMISNWFPQEDVLAHPNVRLFITHGGLMSTMEAVYHAVPIVGIPIFGDQIVNMYRAQNSGYGLMISLTNLTENSISWAVNEILSNEKYLHKAKQISFRFRDALINPLELAKFWVGYVVRHKGAPHLQSAAKDLTFIAYHNLDVFACLAVFIAFIISGLAICIRKLSGYVLTTKNNDVRCNSHRYKKNL